MSALDGVKVDIGGTVFIVPPMNIGTFKRTKADRAALGDPQTTEDDRIDAAVRVVHASLLRNYPDLTIAEVENLLTFANLRRVLPDVVAAWSASEDSDPGKATAETQST